MKVTISKDERYPDYDIEIGEKYPKFNAIVEMSNSDYQHYQDLIEKYNALQEYLDKLFIESRTK